MPKIEIGNVYRVGNYGNTRYSYFLPLKIGPRPLHPDEKSFWGLHYIDWAQGGSVKTGMKLSGMTEEYSIGAEMTKIRNPSRHFQNFVKIVFTDLYIKYKELGVF